jgi:hypothetical protein
MRATVLANSIFLDLITLTILDGGYVLLSSSLFNFISFSVVISLLDPNTTKDYFCEFQQFKQNKTVREVLHKTSHWNHQII